MKQSRIYPLLLSVVVLLTGVCFVSCEGPVGPMGPMGERGERGLAGEEGRDGRDGVDGKDGEDGKDGRDGADGKDGEDGADGKDGNDGLDLWIQVVEGTVLNRNYRSGNPRYASIPVGSSLRGEPTILFLGIENENGVYTKIDFSSVIWGGDSESHAVPGTEGWYILVYDRWKDLVGSNYQVKFVQ